jgi:hypothetical protein
MPTCFLPLQTSGHDLGTVADGCDGPVDKHRSGVEEDLDARCGWCFFRPQFLQRFRTAKWVLFWLCWAGAVQGRNESVHINVVTFMWWAGSSVGIATSYGAGRFGDRIPVGARFSAPVQIGPGAHPASCKMGTRSFLGVESGRT